MDRSEYSDLFRRLFPALVRYAKRIVEDEEAARDVVMDVFVKAWDRRDELEIRVSWDALLYTMVRNRALNRVRNTNRIVSDAKLEDVEGTQATEEMPDPAEEIDAAELRERLMRWIDDLPARRAEAFTLSRFHGLTHEEIAETMGVSKRTAETHVYHALQDLRERLEQLRGCD